MIHYFSNRDYLIVFDKLSLFQPRVCVRLFKGGGSCYKYVSVIIGFEFPTGTG